MNWQKSGPRCTQEQAIGLWDEIVGNWPNQRFAKPEVTARIWVSRFEQWPYRYARDAVDMILNEQKIWPQWADVWELMNNMGLRDQESDHG